MSIANPAAHLERNIWSLRPDGGYETSKYSKETTKYKFDFIDDPGLQFGSATISTLTATGKGVTVTASAIATGRDGSTNTAVTLTIDKTDGYVELILATSDSQTLYRYLHFIDTPPINRGSDYGN